MAQRLLLVNPFGVVTRRATTCNDGEAVFGQALADGGTDAAHAASNIRYFFTHVCLLEFEIIAINICY